MASLAITDACDANEPLIESGDIRILPPIFQVYRQRRAFSGPIAILKVSEDNILVREFLESKGGGRVLVVDGGGSLKCALVGGNLGQLAQNNGWAGIVVNGCIRDVDEIDGCDIGVRALAAHPKKSKQRGAGERHIPIHISGAMESGCMQIVKVLSYRKQSFLSSSCSISYNVFDSLSDKLSMQDFWVSFYCACNIITLRNFVVVICNW